MKTENKKIFSALFGITAISLAIISSTPVYAQSERGNERGETRRENMQRGDRTNMGNSGVFGKVSSISGNTIVVSGIQRSEKNATTSVSYTVDASNATIRTMSRATSTDDGRATGTRPEEKTISLSDIQVGDPVMIQGVVTGTNIVAKSITRSTFQLNGDVKMGIGPGRNNRNMDGATTTPEELKNEKNEGFWYKITNPIKNFFKKIF